MSIRPNPVFGLLLLLVGCAMDGDARSPVPPPPSYSPGPVVYGSGPGGSQSYPPGYQPSYQLEAAPASQPIRAPNTVLPGDGLYGTDPGLQGMAEGNTGQAELDFEKALEVNPFDPSALNNLAVAKAEQGQFHEATALLERAAKLQPNNAEVAANLARLRGYVQGYAMSGVSPSIPKSVNGPLPPPPPALWGTSVSAGYAPSAYVGGYSTYAPPLPPNSEATVTPDHANSYYLSDACKRKTTGTGKSARVDIECEPRR